MANDRGEPAFTLRTRGLFDLVSAFLIAVIAEVLIILRLWWLEDQSVEAVGTSALNVVQSLGGAVGEWVALHVGYLLGIIPGLAVQVAIFMVFAFGLICLARLIGMRLQRP